MWSDGFGGASRCDGVPVWQTPQPPSADGDAWSSWQFTQCRFRGEPHEPRWLRGGFDVWHSTHWSVVWHDEQRSRSIRAARPWPGPVRQKFV